MNLLNQHIMYGYVWTPRSLIDSWISRNAGFGDDFVWVQCIAHVSQGATSPPRPPCWGAQVVAASLKLLIKPGFVSHLSVEVVKWWSFPGFFLELLCYSLPLHGCSKTIFAVLVCSFFVPRSQSHSSKLNCLNKTVFFEKQLKQERLQTTIEKETRWSPRTRMPTRMLRNKGLILICHNFQRTHLWNTLIWHTEVTLL